MQKNHPCGWNQPVWSMRGVSQWDDGLDDLAAAFVLSAPLLQFPPLLSLTLFDVVSDLISSSCDQLQDCAKTLDPPC